MFSQPPPGGSPTRVGRPCRGWGLPPMRGPIAAPGRENCPCTSPALLRGVLLGEVLAPVPAEINRHGQCALTYYTRQRKDKLRPTGLLMAPRVGACPLPNAPTRIGGKKRMDLARGWSEDGHRDASSACDGGQRDESDGGRSAPKHWGRRGGVRTRSPSGKRPRRQQTPVGPSISADQAEGLARGPHPHPAPSPRSGVERA